jgi:hypothetical protein
MTKSSHPFIFKTAMKKVLLFLFATTLFFSCKDDKDKDPGPELSAQVTGNYKVTKLTVNGEEQPLDLAKAVITIQLEKFSAEVVTGKMKAKIDGVSEPDEDLGTLNLKNAGSTGIDIYEGTDKVGNLKGSKLTVFIVLDGDEIEMIADKQ